MFKRLQICFRQKVNLGVKAIFQTVKVTFKKDSRRFADIFLTKTINYFWGERNFLNCGSCLHITQILVALQISFLTETASYFEVKAIF